MTTTLEVFLQGGLGNQLIQLAYATSLQARTGVPVKLNPVLLHPCWSRLRSISHRPRCWPWASTLPEVHRPTRQLLGLLRLYQSRLVASRLTDASSDVELVQQLRGSARANWYGLIGYFQRSEAFTSSSSSFWAHLSQQLRRHYQLIPFPDGQVVAHVRLGDYLWPQNQRLFAAYSVSKQIEHAHQWARRLGSTERIHLVSDDPNTLKRLLGDRLNDCVLHAGQSPEADFTFLLRHRHIVGSNSTFSLCAGRLASELWGERHTLTIPDRWFVDNGLDMQIQSEFAQCPFLQYVSDFLKSPRHK